MDQPRSMNPSTDSKKLDAFLFKNFLSPERWRSLLPGGKSEIVSLLAPTPSGPASAYIVTEYETTIHDDDAWPLRSNVIERVRIFVELETGDGSWPSIQRAFSKWARGVCPQANANDNKRGTG